VQLQRLATRRASEIYANTRFEILVSIGSAIAFLTVMALRFPSLRTPYSELGAAAVITWIIVACYRFRDQIWRSPRADAVFETGVSYYSSELKRRRNHLRNTWIWHGPVLLACLTFAATAGAMSYPRLERTGPFVLLLLIWIASAVWRRARQARELQKEIDELGEGS